MQERELIVHVRVRDEAAAQIDATVGPAGLSSLCMLVAHDEQHGARLQVMEVHTEPSEHLGGFFQAGAPDAR